jgi:hypothetical protein
VRTKVAQARRRRSGMVFAVAVLSGLMVATAALVVSTSAPAGGAVVSWSIVPTPNTSSRASNALFDLSCVSSSDCWAVGDIGLAPFDVQTLAEHWNGSAWSIVPTPNVGVSTFNALNGVTCVTSTDCWATGLGNGTNTTDQTLAEHWNGSTWSVVGTPAPSPVSILGGVACASSSDCWTVGHDGAGPLAEHWNGSSWSVATTPALPHGGELGTVSCVTTSDCWAVGDAMNSGSVQQTLAEHWNGSAWSIVTTADTSSAVANELASVSCVTTSDCWAAGGADNGGGGHRQTLAEHWNGSAWSIITTPDTSSATDNELERVSCITTSECWAVGGAEGGSGAQQTLAEQWNGNAWSIVTTPNTNSAVSNQLGSVTCVTTSGCWAVGSAASGSGGIGQTLAERETGSGYWEVASDGGIFSFGDAVFYGSEGGQPLNAPIVGMASTPDAGGYWEVASDGGIFSFGDAVFYGSEGGQHLNKPIVGMAATPDGRGYWEVASDGGIFSFGDAVFYGSEGGQPLNKPIVGMAATPDGRGYWEVASDGGIFSFGEAVFYGSEGGQPLNAPIVGMATPDGGGYWEVASDGGIFSFGDANFYGSQGGQPLNKPIVGMANPDGGGYWEVASDGGIFSFGDANFFGSEGGQPLNAPIVGMS